MKGTGQKLVMLFLYLGILLYITGFHWKNIFDAKAFLMVVLGMILLSLPQLFGSFRQHRKQVSNKETEGGRENNKKKYYDLMHICSWNALAASYITAVMILLTKLSNGVEPQQMVSEIALGLRPVLYGLLFYVLFHKEEEKTEKDVEQIEGEEKQSEKEERSDRRKCQSLTPEQLCYFFRAKGLTAREAEVARMLYQGCSNREIAVELYIAETTVKKHVTHILEKLKIEQRGQIQGIVSEGLILEEREESDE